MVNFYDFVVEEFNRRKKKNNKYSLREFSRDLDIEAGFLSKVLNRKIQITDKLITRLGAKFSLTKSEIEAYLKHDKILRQPPLPSFLQLKFNQEWIHPSLLINIGVLIELTKTVGFVNDDQLIAKKMNIAIEDVQKIKATLRHVDLVEFENDVKLTLKSGSNSGAWINKLNLDPVKEAETFKDHKRTLTKRQVDHFEKNPKGDSISNLVIALNSMRKAELNREVLKFLEKLNEKYSQYNDPNNSVFEISVAVMELIKTDIKS